MRTQAHIICRRRCKFFSADSGAVFINADSGAYYLQTQVQIFLIADSGAIHTNVTQAHVCEMWTLAHFISCRLWCKLFKCTNATQAHVHVFIFTWFLTYFCKSFVIFVKRCQKLYGNKYSNLKLYFWKSLFLGLVGIFALLSFLCNIIACCSSWSLPLTHDSVVYLTDRSEKGKEKYN